LEVRGLKLFWCLILVFAAQATRAGGLEVNNGGDSVWCKKSSENSLYGFYTLDYLLEMDSNQKENMVPVDAWSESFQRIYNQIVKYDPYMAKSFLSFSEALSNNSLNISWSAQRDRLVDIKDEEFLRILPANCILKLNGQSVAQIHQTVIRKSNFFDSSRLVFEYDPIILNQQRELRPLQYSFLIIHEWLWSFTSDVDSIRIFNRYLHSSRLENSDKDDFVATVRSLKLYRKVLPVCSRSNMLRKKIELLIGKHCSETELSDLEKIDRLSLSSNVDQLNVGDLSGMRLLKNLKVSLGGLANEKIYPSIFWDMYSLETLDLSANGLTKFPEQWFGVRTPLNLRQLDLSLNNFDQAEKERILKMEKEDSPEVLIQF